jgi:hypothetical protein
MPGLEPGLQDRKPRRLPLDFHPRHSLDRVKRSPNLSRTLARHRRTTPIAQPKPRPSPDTCCEGATTKSAKYARSEDGAVAEEVGSGLQSRTPGCKSRPRLNRFRRRVRLPSAVDLPERIDDADVVVNRHDPDD